MRLHTTTLLFLVFTITLSAIVGMDVGTQFSKTSFIGPKKIDIVENEESKRKDPSLLGLDQKNRRVFGSRAQKLALSSPKRVFMYSSKLLGKSYNNPFVEYLQTFLPCPIVPQNATRPNSPPMYQLGNITLSPEQVTAMLIKRQLKNVKRQYQTTVADGVLTISPSTTPIERKALVHSAQLAGLEPLALVNSPMAFAVSLGVNRDLFEKPTNVLFLDVGATSVDIGLFNFSSSGNTSGTIQALGYYTSPYFGGHNFDKVIADIIFKRIQTKVKDTDEKGALFRQIIQQSERAKIVLSVNKETTVTINLPGGEDWSTKITLDEFVEAAEPIRKVLDDILENAISAVGTKKDQIQMVQLLGGGIRVPMVLNTITEFFGDEKINRNVDAEEGGAFGASYYALAQGLGRMKKQYKIKDFVPYDWYLESPFLEKEIRLFSHKRSADSERSVMFKSVKNVTELNFTLSYKMIDNDNANRTAYMVGIGRDIPINETLNTNGVNVSVTFKLNNFGLVDILRGEVKLSAWRNCTEKVYKMVNKTVEVKDNETLSVNGTNSTINSTEQTNETFDFTEQFKKGLEEEEEKDEDITIEEEETKEEEKKTEEKVDNNTNKENVTELNETDGNTTLINKTKEKKYKTVLTPEWEDKKYECVKNETNKVNFHLLFHPLVSFMMRNEDVSKKVIKWFEDNDDIFKKLGELVNAFESKIYKLRQEINDRDQLDNKEELLKELNDQQEFLEFNDIDDIQPDDMKLRIELLQNITEILHPELRKVVETNSTNSNETNSTEDSEDLSEESEEIVEVKPEEEEKEQEQQKTEL
ncbi:heat shock protein 70kD, putative [Entamoeba invadens IP1]|uniref:Heat shock protein 70kD, putative n=1 Tax=Entamoeba invadens IP1 TaxID=370355 RepID=A0A0A1U2K5_ENTIV|nr:heat shock protein 70kD, putative [Entamoeba invadens IP1]ELP88264.1 heat shock protein 70kD, putative [Entamoeba invadens IP1]|eukprot:XP_004255035.1 heat shock protein 70kD, putative [Entamoeba invadens IP1]